METFNSFLVQSYMNALWDIRPDNLRTMTDVLLTKFTEGNINDLVQLQDKKPAEKQFVQRDGRMAVLNIEGVLVPKASWLDSMCGFVSTIQLHSLFKGLMKDDSLDRIILYVDSPGGAATGIFEFAESIYQARSEKEIVSFTDVQACSAGYALFSAAENAVAAPSASICSVGTYITVAKSKENSEFDVHLIGAGDKKLFGHPDLPISDDEVASFREKVDTHYEAFTNMVAKFRGVSQEDVKNTKADYFDAINAPEWAYDHLGDTDFILS